MKEVVALVPVKGNSERVNKKNIRKFGDTTLLELKLDQLVKTKESLNKFSRTPVNMR